MNNSQFQTGQGVEIQFNGKITINAQIIRALIAEITPPTPEKLPALIPERPPASSPQRKVFTFKQPEKTVVVESNSDKSLDYSQKRQSLKHDK